MKITYNSISDEFIRLLQEHVSCPVRIGADISEDYSHDEMPIYGKRTPGVLVEAESTEDVIAVMKLCNEHRIPVTPRGAGTGLVGGAVPIYGGVLISTTRMNQILSYDLDNMNARVQPGVLLQDFIEDVSRKGLFYPPDPGEKLATVGGNVSTNAGGMRAVKYGTTRDYVLGMTVVLPTGEVLKLGSPVSKTSSGYSLLDLIIGSEGTLGIITELTLRLIPQPPYNISIILPFASLKECISAVPVFKKNHIQPQALEFMERDIVDWTEKYLNKEVFPKVIDGVDAKAYLLLTLDGDNMDFLETAIEKTAEIALGVGALDAFLIDTPSNKREIWNARGAFLEAIISDVTYVDECDVVVPLSSIADFLEYVNAVGKETGVTVKSFGHAGDGNIHIYACGKEGTLEEFKAQSKKFFDLIYDRAIALNGQVSGEHGIGHGKMSYLEKSIGTVGMRVMHAIKQAMDPNMILNPGKVCFSINDSEDE